MEKISITLIVYWMLIRTERGDSKEVCGS
jgi:hypothetical protein